jgi:hypothetical protein
MRFCSTNMPLMPEAGLLNKRLMLSLSFSCDKIYKYEIYNFGHALLCYLNQTWMFSKPTSESGLINKSLCLAPALGVTKLIIATDMIWVTLCCAT